MSEQMDRAARVSTDFAPTDLRALLEENERLAAKVKYVEYLIRHDDAAMDLWWTVTDDNWAVPDCMPGRFLRAALDGSGS